MLNIVLKSNVIVSDWPVFEKTVFYLVFIAMADFMADYIYGTLLGWCNRQYFRFVLVYGIVFAIFILSGVFTFAVFLERAFVFWLQELWSWRFLPLMLGVAAFLRFAFQVIFKKNA